MHSCVLFLAARHYVSSFILYCRNYLALKASGFEEQAMPWNFVKTTSEIVSETWNMVWNFILKGES